MPVIYVLTYSMRVYDSDIYPIVDDIFDSAYTDKEEAIKVYNNTLTTQSYPKKQLWLTESAEDYTKRELLMEEKYVEKCSI